MYCMMYFDVEDFFSAPDEPVHQLPGRFAEIMTKYGLPGSFHIVGEQAWTLKPAFRRDEYAAEIEVGVHLNPALPFAVT